MQTLLGKHWHHLPVEEVVELLETDQQNGLDIFEIQHRQERFGPNVLTPRKGKSPFKRFLQQFNNPLIYILLASSLITAVLKDVVDAVIIFGVVLINAIIGYIQEAKAEEAIQALANTMTTDATVVRVGKPQRIPASQLVPGDLVVLKSGDKVPADLRLIRTRDLQIAEASLTGESMPVQKSAEINLSKDTPLAERQNMAYASTLVTYGQGTGTVTAIGDGTEVGRISHLISTAEELATPLTRKIAQFSRIILYAILGLAVAVFIISVLRGQAIVDTLMATIALAVAMIPEGLPAALTVTLAIGVSRMARRRAIIRKLPAVEALGSTTIICSDKTGTLTQNQMTVQKIYVSGAHYKVTGLGYSPEGEICQQDGKDTCQTIESPEQFPAALQEILKAGILSNDSALIQNGNEWQAQGDPTEVALIVSARKAGLNADMISSQYPRIDAIPFESQHQYMATLHSRGEVAPAVVYIKGAAEAILERCADSLDNAGERSPLSRAEILRQVEEMASEGLRVLAFARLEMPTNTLKISHQDLQSGFTFLGLQGLIDPPRQEAIAAVKTCQNAGIQVKMITGDHALTAAAIAKKIGLTDAGGSSSDEYCVLTGKEIAELSDNELIESAAQYSVFARVSPEQKLRLVEALQARGNIVAMTGDGVNDGPALKRADIGVAMGVTGTDVAKEAADMVLTDDNFATIEAAVEEGRGVFDNLTKIIAWTLPTNIGEGLILLAALILGVALPILPVQILWINMVSVSVLGIVLAMELREPGIMNRRPRNPNAPILSGELIWRVFLVGGLILLGAFGLFEYELANGASLAQARTVAVNAVIMIEIFYLLNCRSLTRSMFQIGVFSNRWVVIGILAMVVLQIMFTYIPVMNTWLASAPISLEAWSRIFLVGLVSYLIVEIEKWIRRRRQNEGFSIAESEKQLMFQ
jgi:Ca2+-transporting ATPase